MKKIIALALALVMLFALCACGSSAAPAAEKPAADKADTPAAETSVEAWEPTQPITILNYVAAGGAMDLATRKFVEIASKYTDATFVVDNMTGASGMIAADYVMTQPADGYLIYATTVTYIYGIAAAEEDASKYIDGLTWIDNIMADPYCILVPSSSDYTLDSLVEEAKNGTPPEMIEWFQDLCQKVTEDPDWQAYFAPQFVSVTNEMTDDFTARVKSDFETGKTVLKGVGMISEDYEG